MALKIRGDAMPDHPRNPYQLWGGTAKGVKKINIYFINELFPAFHTGLTQSIGPREGPQILRSPLVH
jgi:hypothetical protein